MRSRTSPKGTWIKKPTDEERLRNIKYLSGPISWFTYKYQDVDYIFFGDKHLSRDNNCESNGIQCVNLYDSFGIPKNIGLPECASIAVYLDLLLNYNNKNNIVTDVFTEFPFVKTEIDKPDIIPDDYMNDVFMIFTECLKRNKRECPYGQNIRVHYADIRKKYRQFTDENISVAVGPVNFNIDSGFIDDSGIHPYYYMSYIFPYIRNFIIADNSKAYLQKEIYDMRNIFDFVYENAFYFFKIITEETDIRPRLDLLVENIPNNLQKKIMEKQLDNILDMSSTRDNKLMFKIAVQLRSLRLSGKADMAEKIIMFMSKKLTLILNNFRTNYQNFLTHCSKYLTTEPKNWINDNDYIIYAGELYKDLLQLGSINIDTYLLARMFKYNNNQVITYTGNYHIDVYREFFKDMLSTDPINEHEGIRSNRCIDNFSTPNL
jgi:hypothetical protein